MITWLNITINIVLRLPWKANIALQMAIIEGGPQIVIDTHVCISLLIDYLQLNVAALYHLLVTYQRHVVEGAREVRVVAPPVGNLR